ncbi:hypothetical protein EDC01DRAFT_636940 [Geopyxis carbonaria]|nr:hypothetical protein EDC01DRAFT_636940 [Geopyxis carbonaria]
MSLFNDLVVAALYIAVLSHLPDIKDLLDLAILCSVVALAYGLVQHKLEARAAVAPPLVAPARRGPRPTPAVGVPRLRREEAFYFPEPGRRAARLRRKVDEACLMAYLVYLWMKSCRRTRLPERLSHLGGSTKRNERTFRTRKYSGQNVPKWVVYPPSEN